MALLQRVQVPVTDVGLGMGGYDLFFTNKYFPARLSFDLKPRILFTIQNSTASALNNVLFEPSGREKESELRRNTSRILAGK